MFIKINEHEFTLAFDQVNRAENFTWLARRELFRWYEDLEENTGESIELDPIAICCDWSEYTAGELMEEFGYLIDDESPVVVEHRVNKNERGEFSATFWLYNEDGETEIASYTGHDLEVMREDGINTQDLDSVLAELSLEYDGLPVYDTTEAAEAALEGAMEERLDSLLDMLEDETTVIVVDQFNEGSTYLIGEF